MRWRLALTAGSVSRLISMRGYLAAGLGSLRMATQRKRAHTPRDETATAKVIDGQSSAWVGAANLLLARVAVAEDDRAEARQHLTRRPSSLLTPCTLTITGASPSIRCEQSSRADDGPMREWNHKQSDRSLHRLPAPLASVRRVTEIILAASSRDLTQLFTR